MMTRPSTTGRLPSSPPRRRCQNSFAYPPRPWVRISRSSARSAATLDTVASSAMLRLLLTALGAGGDDVVGGTGDRRHELLGAGLLDLELGGVPAEPEHDDPVRDRLDVGHVVADQDHAEPVLAQPLDEVEHL